MTFAIRHIPIVGLFLVAAACSGAEKTGGITRPIPIASLSLSPTSKTLQIADSAQFTAVALDANGSSLSGRAFAWKSSDEAVMRVSATGLVTGIGAGNAVLSVESEGKQRTAAITVTAPVSVGPSLTRVENFVVGQPATVYGRNLGLVTAVTVDGVAITFRLQSDSAIAFVVPVTRSCETDGRIVQIDVAPGAGVRLAARIKVAVSTTLQPGQSVLLAADTLSCLQLPAADNSYVLTVLNPDIPPDRTATSPWPPAILDLLTFRTGPVPQSVPTRVASSSVTDISAEELFARDAAAATVGATYVAAPLPFDPKYPSARVGDTVRFPVAYKLQQLANYCSMDRAAVRADSTLGYAVLVVAISGSTVIGIDLRATGNSQYLTTSGRVFLQAAADAAEPYIVPAARMVFDANYAPLTGGGGRHYAIITTQALYNPARTGWAGIAGDLITEMPQSSCALASEMHAVFFDGTYFPTAGPPGFLASVIVHEFAHQAETKTQTITGTISGNPEAWAVTAQDAAMHLALRTFTQAHYDQLGRQLPFEPNVLATTWTRTQARRLWDPTAGYSQGALFLVLMREWTADTGATPKQQTLWQRTVGRYLWNSFQQNLGASAALLATTPLDLLDRYSLASATDDLVAPDAAAKFGLPQIASWDSQSYSVPKPLGISRTAPVQRTLSAGPGGYDAAYLFGDGGNGLSLEFTSVAKVPMRIRLTRLR